MTDAVGEYHQHRFVVEPDATEILLVRHGASAPVFPGVDHDVDADGRGDPPLAPEGFEQAKRVAARLRHEQINALFVTPLQRTTQTATPLAELTGLQPVVIPDLTEIHLGVWEPGEHRIRASQNDPLWHRALREQRWDVIPGAESMESFSARVRAGVDSIRARLGPGRISVAFIHGGVIGEICRQAVESQTFGFIYAENGSITRVVCQSDGRWVLRSFNETAHLDLPVDRRSPRRSST